MRRKVFCVGLAILGAVVTMVCGVSRAGAAEYSWQQPHAKVLPQGDLEWAPRPFVFEKGESVRYIDYESGDDANDGLTKTTPWKHHPWDANATGKAKECEGIHTYVFKRGAIYRGALTAAESGVPGNPIRLTSDPDWGTGEACLFGSEQIKDGWKRCDAQSAPGIPQPEKVWYRDMATDQPPWALWETRGEDVIRIPIARAPNWTITNPDDPQKDWWTWKGRAKVPDNGGIDPEHITSDDPHFYDGGAVYTEWSGNMGTVYRREVQAYDVKEHALRCGKGRAGNRYFIENVRGLLDAPGEYFYARTPPFAQRLYVRMPEGRDPNTCVLEASRIKWLIVLRDKSNIVISGLRFSFNDVGNPGSDRPIVPMAPVVIRIAGDSHDVHVTNCRFFHIAGAVSAFPRPNQKHTEAALPDLMPWHHDTMNHIEVNDNDIEYCDRSAIMMNSGMVAWGVEWPPRGEFKKARIMRNRLHWIAIRPGGYLYSALPTISADALEEVEIAGNILDRCCGAGISTLGGRRGNNVEVGDTPLTRILIHHNKVTNTMLSCNDYGGIEPWQGGSNYVYNNISGNCIGARNYVSIEKPEKTTAYNFYLDGTFKSYVFNNIAWGGSNSPDSPYRSRAPFMQVIGFMNHWFNNTAYGFMEGFHGSAAQRCSFLGNVLNDMTWYYMKQGSKHEASISMEDAKTQDVPFIPSLAYGENIFFGPPSEQSGKMFVLKDMRAATPEEMSQKLAALKTKLSSYGRMAAEQPLRDPANHDFRPVAGSGVEGNGVKFFVPWSLYAMVGEWNFYRDPSDPKRVTGENFYMSDEYMQRRTYYEIPRNDLDVPGGTLDDYISGPLEDWTPGAMKFDGKSRYCVLPDNRIKSGYTLTEHIEPGGKDLIKGKWTYPGERRKTVDMNDNNFLIEVYFKTDLGFRSGVLVSKRGANNGRGYQLSVDDTGTLSFTVQADASAGVTTTNPINDGRWRHIIAEVDRMGGMMRLYVDGKLDIQAKVDLEGSCSNTGDFLLGKGNDGRFFAGAVDFLRVSRGTLKDAKTTIDELYAWEFDGPFLRGFCGVKPQGKRNAGALLLSDN
jgi:concanavalin A-like lectin/glucanase superfamily protein